MLIIPITGKLSWKNPPYVTLAFILVNVLVYLVWQSDDSRIAYQAHTFYFESGLAKIELSYYTAHRFGDPELANPDQMEVDQKGMIRLYQEMEADDEFKKRLLANQVITEKDPHFLEWKEKRDRYQELLSGMVSFRYGFRPADGTLLTAFSYMFLHGSFGHLLGNMIFLWLVGCLLEMGCGRLFPVIVYLVTGLCAALLFWAIYMDSTTPLVGASGAIAGFMGAFALIYGKARVKIFYSLGFYFNYVRFPAIALFPVWLGNECYQLFFGPQSNIAYAAHIGGLLSGAGLGYLKSNYWSSEENKLLEDEPVDRTSPLLEKALQHIGELEMAQGRKLLAEILEAAPNHSDALLHLFHVDKLQPETSRFHQTAKRLLTNLCSQKDRHEKALHVYEEYIGLAKPPKLSPELYLRIGSIMAGKGRIRESELILLMLLKRKPDLAGLSTGFFQLAEACRVKGEQEKWQNFLHIINRRFPGSEEARLAQNRLDT